MAAIGAPWTQEDLEGLRKADRAARQPADAEEGKYTKRSLGWPLACQQQEQQRNREERRGSRKQAWSGWGPAVFPKARKVAGWEWDNHLNGYLANRPQRFACECGNQIDTPSGFRRCACGKQWNSYVIGTGGSNREASAEKFLVREIPVRTEGNVIMANRKMASFLGHTPDHKIPEYLEHLRGKVRNQNIDWGELAGPAGACREWIHPS